MYPDDYNMEQGPLVQDFLYSQAKKLIKCMLEENVLKLGR